MNKLSVIRKAVSFYPEAERKQQVRQAVKYAQALEYLGDKWILAKPVNKVKRNVV